MEAEVEHREGFGLLAQARDRARQRLALVVDDERQERGEPGARGGQRRRSPVVVLGANMKMAVDETREYEFPRGVNHAAGRR